MLYDFFVQDLLLGHSGQNHLGTQLVSLVLVLCGQITKLPSYQARICKKCILASEGRRDSAFSLKCSELLHLYTSSYATYALNPLFFEIIFLKRLFTLHFDFLAIIFTFLFK